MSAHASARFVGILLMIATAPAAGAMELSQGGAPGSDPSSGFAFPMFLDGARLPDLQEAWRARFGTDEGPAASAATRSYDPVATTIDAARQALTRAEQVTRDAAAVRDRAEALSRRFADSHGDGASSPTAASPVTDPVTESEAPTETASINPPADQMPVPVAEQGAAPSDVPVDAAAGSPMEQTAAAAPSATDDAPVLEDMATEPAKIGRRDTSRVAPRAPVQATVHDAPGASGLLKVHPVAPSRAPGPDQSTLMPSELRAFGWSSQP